MQVYWIVVIPYNFNTDFNGSGSENIEVQRVWTTSEVSIQAAGYIAVVTRHRVRDNVLYTALVVRRRTRNDIRTICRCENNDFTTYSKCIRQLAS